MNGRRAAALVTALVVVVAVAVALSAWRPWDPVPDALRAAVHDAAAVPGVVSTELTTYEVTQRDAKDGDAARADVTVVLDPGLAPDAARRAAERAHDVLAAQVDGVRSLSLDTTVRAGTPRTVHGITVYPLTAWVADDGDATSVADAYRLWRAGATSVSGASADAADGDALVALARASADAGLTASLATADGAVQYDAYQAVPDVPAVRLAVASSRRPGVEIASFAASMEPRLSVALSVPAASAQARALVRWLDDPARASGLGRPVAYTLSEPGFATLVDGWVGDVAPPEPAEHTVPLPDGVAAWPDVDAPACTGADLRLALSAPDAAAGSRYLAVLARNVSGSPCALDGTPGLVFRDAAGDAQPDVTLAPSAPGVVPGRVVVPPGERARASLQWGAMSTALDPDVTTTVDVVPVPDAEAVSLTPKVPGVGPVDLDVLDGATVRVSPWVQAAEGWS
ncbi:DUF4232 domain-containing protein [Isoptericola sp. NPDC055881]